MTYRRINEGVGDFKGWCNIATVDGEGTVGQNCGEMLAETGSFDVLFWYWVLGIGYSGIYIHIYVYIYIEYWVLGYIHICTHIYILRMEDEVILHGQSS